MTKLNSKFRCSPWPSDGPCKKKAIVGVLWTENDIWIFGRCPHHYAEDHDVIYNGRGDTPAAAEVYDMTDEAVIIELVFKEVEFVGI